MTNDEANLMAQIIMFSVVIYLFIIALLSGFNINNHSYFNRKIGLYEKTVKNQYSNKYIDLRKRARFPFGYIIFGFISLFILPTYLFSINTLIHIKNIFIKIINIFFFDLNKRG